MTTRRRPIAAALFAVLFAVLLVGSFAAGLAAAAPVAAAPGPSAAAPVAPPAATPGAPAAQPLGNGTGNESGPGVFYSTEALPGASFSNATCVSGSCYSVTNDVSTTVLPNGEIVAAYTTLTDESPCAALRPYSVSNIAITTSADGGSTWSPVQYLGNPNCASSGYPDAWEPSIASLGNGTLVLAYVEYNLSAGSLPPLTAYSWPPTESRLVLSESYDAGVSWSTPAVLNISNPPGAPPGLQYTPALPSVATFGQTIYVTWMSLTIQNSEGSIALLVSSDGGASWSPTVAVSTGGGYSMDPEAIVLPSGMLAIGYTTDVGYTSFICGASGCVGYFPGVWAGSVEVATSFYNGTVFNYSTVASEVPLGSFAWAPWRNPTSFGPFENPAPQLAYSNATGQIYLAFTGGMPVNGTTYCFTGQTGCLADDLFFYSSPDNGTTWNEGNIGTVLFNPGFIDPTSTANNGSDSVPAVSIAAEGSTVYVEASYYNGSLCDGPACGVATEVVFDTSDNGTTFSAPVTLSAQYTPYDYAWTGEYSSIAFANGSPRYFWTLDACPGWATVPCSSYPYSNLPLSQVSVSELFNGTGGATLNFNAVGLGAGVNWTVSVSGNVRAGPGNATLSVSGIPKGVPIFFSVPGINETSVRYYVLAGAIVPASPATLSKNLTVTVTFTPYVPVTISYSVPNIQGPACINFGFAYMSGCPSFYPGCLGAPMGNYTESCYSYYFNPTPPVGEEWVPAGHADSVGIAPFPYPVCWYYYGGIYGYTYCYIYEFFLEPLGWSGTGPGSISTTALNITFYPEGPVTETASFLETGYCMSFYENFTGSIYLTNYGCQNFTSPLTIEETGLPAGDSWAVTLSGAAGTGTLSALAGTPIVNDSAAVGIAGIVPWNVPSGTPGEVYVGTPSVLSPMILPDTTPVVINYTLEPLAAAVEPVEVRAIGLPTGLSGNLSVENTGTGASLTLPAGPSPFNTTLPAGEYSLNASDVITTGGTSYYPSAIYSNIDLVGNANQSGPSPTSIDLGAPGTITVAYSAEYWVTISGGLGGTVSPASRWVDSGGTVSLSATPNSGYEFLYWVGTGPGSTSGAQALLEHVAIVPGGPVSEFAVFGVRPPPTWTVTVIPAGIPAGQEYSIALGSATYSGVGTFRITNLSSSTYALGIPDVESAATSLVRYVLSSVTASAGLGSGNALTVSANLTLYPVFAAEYLVSLSTVGNGTLSVAPGAFWNASNTTLRVTASPERGATFVGWWATVGSGPTSLITSNRTLALVVSASTTIVAEFAPAPAVVTPTYEYTFVENGLPSGVLWQVTLAPGAGASGRTGTLEATVTNGTYTLNVGTVYSAPGVRFVSNVAANSSVTVAGNGSKTINFTEEVLVLVSSSGGGSASGGGWSTAGVATTITAAPAPAGLTFSGWRGTGPGSYSGTNLSATIVPTGPVTETATYVPTTSTSTSSSTASLSDVAWLAIVVIALLAVGLAEGWAVMRRRKPPAQSIASAPPRAAVRPAPSAPALPPVSPARPPGSPPPPPDMPWRET